jgi:hypothetical protein
LYLFDQSTLTGQDHPYWFGKTDLKCLMRSGRKKGKRGAPHKYTLACKHRWIKYCGHYFEFLGRGKLIYSSSSTDGAGSCSQSQESQAAGYSVLSVDCIKRCTRSYEEEFGDYNFLLNNFHHFANRLSDILCRKSSYPNWCNWRSRSY